MSPLPTALSAKVDAVTALLARVASTHAPAVFASSFGAEDMVLFDVIARRQLPIDVFTLDTGRLPEETHALIDHVRAHYDLPVLVYAPDALAIEDYVLTHGANAFYASLDLRERCCALRKSAPLARALAGKRAWITGLRRAQSVTRRDIAVEEFDERHRLAKFNPLADWSRDEVWAYIRAEAVPYNALHDRGYASIGCAPCTRAVKPGEHERAGRWWWEEATKRECGLHTG